MPDDWTRNRQPGERLSLPADAYNAWTRTALRTTVTPPVPDVPPSKLGQFALLAKNGTGGNLDQYSIVEVSDMLYPPATNEQDFRARPCPILTAPDSATHTNWGITLAPIAEDLIGPVLIAGAAPCKITVTDTDITRAKPQASTASLVDADPGDGGATILWKAGGTGEQWALVALPAAPAAQSNTARVWYVDASATGADDGTTWADAFTDLQSALAACSHGDEIWVANGTYSPGTARTNYFELVSGVGIYGGFAGGEADRDAADPAVNATILTGALTGAGAGSYAYHVVYGAGVRGAVVDGCTISDGVADGASYRGFGGGVNLLRAAESSGTGSFAWFRRCIIEDNSASIVGGGICVHTNCIAVLEDCIIRDNTASGSGTGGGGYCTSTSTVIVRDTTLSGNTSGATGGAWQNGATFERCNFTGNTATGGGAIHIQQGAASISDCIMRDSTATSANQAGTLVHLANAACAIARCTIVDSTQATATYGPVLSTQATMTIVDSIIRETTGNWALSGTIAATYSAIYPTFAGTGNVDADPRFVAEYTDLRVWPDSPCIGNASGAARGTTDVYGHVRLGEDMGAVAMYGAYPRRTPFRGRLEPAASDGTTRLVITAGDVYSYHGGRDSVAEYDAAVVASRYYYLLATVQRDGSDTAVTGTVQVSATRPDYILDDDPAEIRVLLGYTDADAAWYQVHTGGDVYLSEYELLLSGIPFRGAVVDGTLEINAGAVYSHAGGKDAVAAYSAAVAASTFYYVQVSTAYDQQTTTTTGTIQTAVAEPDFWTQTADPAIRRYLIGQTDASGTWSQKWAGGNIYVDEAPTVKESVEYDTDGAVHLVNDEATPDNSDVYARLSGAKGWQAFTDLLDAIGTADDDEVQVLLRNEGTWELQNTETFACP